MDNEPLSRETAMVIAALRAWQRLGRKQTLPEQDLATDGGRLKPLSIREIDRLVVRINFGEIALTESPADAAAG